MDNVEGTLEVILTDDMPAKIHVLVSDLSLVFCDKISGRRIPALIKVYCKKTP